MSLRAQIFNMDVSKRDLFSEQNDWRYYTIRCIDQRRYYDLDDRTILDLS